MGKILVFGHKSPDTDSVTSAIVMTNLERKLGNEDVYACVLGKLNKETMEIKTKTKFCQYCGQKFNWFTRHLF